MEENWFLSVVNDFWSIGRVLMKPQIVFKDFSGKFNRCWDWKWRALTAYKWLSIKLLSSFFSTLRKIFARKGKVFITIRFNDFFLFLCSSSLLSRAVDKSLIFRFVCLFLLRLLIDVAINIQLKHWPLILDFLL